MKEKVLIALGDAHLSNAITKKLKLMDYEAYEARSGKEALDKMRLLKPDLALVDTDLTIVDGYEVLNQKSFDREITKIPVIVVSNSGKPLRMREIPSTPVIKDFLIKAHIEPDEVMEKIEKIFGKTSTAETAKVSGAGKTVLWVEDDKLLSTILSKKISGAGYELLKANDGDEAMKLLDKASPDIIILDILLPGASGFDVLQKIKMDQKLKKIPVIMLSNMSRQSDIDKSKQLGATKFIVKAAVSLDEIIHEIGSHIK